jgi:hypothetical protein
MADGKEPATARGEAPSQDNSRHCARGLRTGTDGPGPDLLGPSETTGSYGQTADATPRVAIRGSDACLDVPFVAHARHRSPKVFALSLPCARFVTEMAWTAHDSSR